MNKLEDLDLHGNDEFGDEDDGAFDATLFTYADLSKIDLKEELAIQYGKAKTLYGNIEKSSIYTPNQKAAVLNTVTAIISSIVRNQEKVQNMDRVKALEEALTDALKTLPEDAQKVFYEKYEANLEKYASISS